MSWQMVDEGWGRRAVDFATLGEPPACREYVAVHHHLGIGAGDRVLDVACGSGLALELARVRGAEVSGIDASPRLVAVAADRNPGCDIRVGDMGDLPWPDASFDVVTSFRGIWGTTPNAVREAHRVLVPGGRLAITVWGNVGKSPGAWMFAPFLWAAEDKVQHQADMNALGRPGVGEAFLAEAGFDVAERFEIPFVLEYADPDTYARALAATGPSYESMQSIGEEEFLARARDLAAERVREGLPLRGAIQEFGYVGTKR
jgi:SAM-dependent methyltransferase